MMLKNVTDHDEPLFIALIVRSKIKRTEHVLVYQICFNSLAQSLIYIAKTVRHFRIPRERKKISFSPKGLLIKAPVLLFCNQ